jgi:hypothetical protein
VELKEYGDICLREFSLEKRKKMKKILLFLSLALFLNASDSYYDRGKLVELKKVLTSRDSNNKGIEYFLTKNGKKVGITDEILVQCKVGVDCKDLLNQFDQFNVSKLTDTIFTVKVENYDSIFSLSRALFDSGKVEFAHPNFIKEKKLR